MQKQISAPIDKYAEIDVLVLEAISELYLQAARKFKLSTTDILAHEQWEIDTVKERLTNLIYNFISNNE